jgi:predicted DNA-binding WGR domain protein
MAFLTRTDPTRNIKRFYIVDITPTLFGEWALVREWGRRGSPGTVRLSSYAMRNEAETAEARTIKRRLEHGYRGVRVMHLDLSDDERRPPRGAATAHRRVGSAPAYRIGARENGRSEPRLGGPD